MAARPASGPLVALATVATIVLLGAALVSQSLDRALLLAALSLTAITALANLVLQTRLQRQVAERESIQSELLDATRAMAVGDLAGAVAHEVNNPLTGILGYTELLLDECPADDPRREDLTTIRDEAVRARSIVRSLVDLAQKRAGERRPTSLVDVVRAGVRTVAGRSGTAAITFSERYAELPDMAIDPAAIGSALVGVLDNAVVAMPDGGTILVTVEREDPHRAVVTISDTGRGMDPQTLRRVFEPFFTTYQERSGRGMGLAIGLSVVRDHGGTIWIDSRPGEGTTVEIRLPIEPLGERPGASGRPANATEVHP